MARMFGTDGVRGIANQDLTCELAFKLGQASAFVLASNVHRPASAAKCWKRLWCPVFVR